MKLFGLTNLCDLLDPEKEQKKNIFIILLENLTVIINYCYYYNQTNEETPISITTRRSSTRDDIYPYLLVLTK